MPDWQININDKPATFKPNPQRAMLGDNVYWTNNTNEDHQPWPLDSDGEPAPEPGWNVPPIPPQESSPSLPVPGTETGVTLPYCCRLHPEEKGAIEVLAAPPTF